MFKRRTPPSTISKLGRWFWPRGGWFRAITYMAYRIRRLPDPAYKISRGIAAGVFTCFTPFFGLHFLISAGLAWIVGGNVLAALLATFFGNPLTFPIIAGMSVELGSWMMGLDRPMPLDQTFDAFSRGSVELWANIGRLFTGAPLEWDDIETLLDHVFVPYLVGGLVPGAIAGALAYALSRPLITTYQKARIARLKKKIARQRDLDAADAADISDGETKP